MGLEVDLEAEVLEPANETSPDLVALALVEAAHGAARSKGNYLATQFHRLLPRLGKKKAIVAVAHSLLVIAYHVLKNGTTYRDLGANYFDQRERDQVRRRLVRRLEHLGFQVNLEPRPATG